MAFEDYSQKESVVIVYTGDGKGKTSAGIGLLARGLGAGWKVAFIQFIKLWEVNEHKFLKTIAPLYEDKLIFYKGGKGFFEAGELSSKASREEHIEAAKATYDFAYECTSSGEFDLVICDEINNATHDGLIEQGLVEKLIKNKHARASLCLTGRNFPGDLLHLTDIATDMTKMKHHFDDKFLANPGIDY